MKPAQGIIFVVSGKKKYLKQAIFSARSIKKFSPQIPVTCFTSIPTRCKYFDEVVVIPQEENPFKIKVRYLRASPYQRTLFLDSDTYLRSGIDHIFGMLDEQSVWLANEPVKVMTPAHKQHRIFRNEKVLNTGLILYDKTAQPLLEAWYEAVSAFPDEEIKLGTTDDQTVFNQLLKNQENPAAGRVSIGILDNTIYNVRPWIIPTLKELGLFEQAIIIHDHTLYNSFFHRLLDFVKIKIKLYQKHRTLRAKG